MSNTATGKVKVVNATNQVSEKLAIREFVIEIAGEYPQSVIFQLKQDKCGLADSLNLNDEVTVSYNLRGREWTSPQGEVKYFNTLEAWKIDKVSNF